MLATNFSSKLFLLLAIVSCLTIGTAAADAGNNGWVTYSVGGDSIGWNDGLSTFGVGLYFGMGELFTYSAVSPDFVDIETQGEGDDGIYWDHHDWSGTIVGGPITLTRTTCYFYCQTVTMNGELLGGSLHGSSDWWSDSHHTHIYAYVDATFSGVWPDGSVSDGFFDLSADEGTTTGTITFTPEPSTLLFFGTGAIAIAVRRKQRA